MMPSIVSSYFPFLTRRSYVFSLILIDFISISREEKVVYTEKVVNSYLLPSKTLDWQILGLLPKDEEIRSKDLKKAIDDEYGEEVRPATFLSRLSHLQKEPFKLIRRNEYNSRNVTYQFTKMGRRFAHENIFFGTPSQQRKRKLYATFVLALGIVQLHDTKARFDVDEIVKLLNDPMQRLPFYNEHFRRDEVMQTIHSFKEKGILRLSTVYGKKRYEIASKTVMKFTELLFELYATEYYLTVYLKWALLDKKKKHETNYVKRIDDEHPIKEISGEPYNKPRSLQEVKEQIANGLRNAGIFRSELLAIKNKVKSAILVEDVDKLLLNPVFYEEQYQSILP